MVEPAKSDRSMCGTCDRAIPYSKLRVGIKKVTSRGRYYCKKEWFHLSCFEIERCVVAGQESFTGFENLDESHKIKFKHFLTKLARPACRRLKTRRGVCGENSDETDINQESLERYARACRVVVAQFVAEFKQSVFEKEGRNIQSETGPTAADQKHKVIICPVKKCEITWEEAHVHHCKPSFDSIVRIYAKAKKLDLGSIRYHLGSFLDQRLAHDFYDFHKAQCKLLVVHKDANLGVLKRKK